VVSHFGTRSDLEDPFFRPVLATLFACLAALTGGALDAGADEIPALCRVIDCSNRPTSSVPARPPNPSPGEPFSNADLGAFSRRVDPDTGAPVRSSDDAICKYRSADGLPTPNVAQSVGPDGFPASGDERIPSVGNCLLFDDPLADEPQVLRAPADIAADHTANQTLFALACATTFDPNTGWCIVDLLNDVTIWGAISNALTGQNGIRGLAAEGVQDVRLEPDDPLDPFELRRYQGLGPGVFLEALFAPLAPGPIDLSDLPDRVQALLGCGPAFVTPCDPSAWRPGSLFGDPDRNEDLGLPRIPVGGIDILNAPAWALLAEFGPEPRCAKLPDSDPDPECSPLEILSANLQRVLIAGETTGPDRAFDPPETAQELAALLAGDLRPDYFDPVAGPDGIRFADFDASGDGRIEDGRLDVDQKAIVASGGQLVANSLADCVAAAGPSDDVCYLPLQGPVAGGSTRAPPSGLLVGALPLAARYRVRLEGIGQTFTTTPPMSIVPVQQLTPIELQQLEAIKRVRVDASQFGSFTGPVVACPAGGGAQVCDSDANGVVDLTIRADSVFGAGSDQTLLYLDADQDGTHDLDQDEDDIFDFIDDGTPGPVTDDNVACGSGIPGDVLQDATQIEMDALERAKAAAMFPDGLPPRSPSACRSVSSLLALAQPDASGQLQFLWHLPELAEIEVDILPRALVAGRRGLVPVVLFGSAQVDVTELDLRLLRFGQCGDEGARALPRGHRRLHGFDRNRDGFDDALVLFQRHGSNLTPDDGEACVVGETVEGAPLEGRDSVRVLRPPRRHPRSRW
jgi:hypothetical protein